MQIGQIIRELHGKTFEIVDWEILGPVIIQPMGKHTVLDHDIYSQTRFILVDDVGAIEFNLYYRVYIKYKLNFIKYEPEYDSRKGYWDGKPDKKKSTKTTWDD